MSIIRIAILTILFILLMALPSQPSRVSGSTVDNSFGCASSDNAPQLGCDILSTTDQLTVLDNTRIATSSQADNGVLQDLDPIRDQVDTDCTKVAEIPLLECEALVALYENTNGPKWQERTGWLVTNTPCSWYGVTCADGHVTSLILNGAWDNRFGLIGDVPPEIGNLSHLNVLGLGGNLLRTLPAEIDGLTNLTDLAIWANPFYTLPNEVWNLHNLQKLSLTDIGLSALPVGIGNLSQLTYLDLNYNQLSTLPNEIWSLSNLVHLNLSTNQLSLLSNQINNLSSLNLLYLNNNRLKTLPIEIGSLTNLVTFDTAYNRLRIDDSLLPFMNKKDSDWLTTQTVPPVWASEPTGPEYTLNVQWEPIAYTNDGGFYELSYGNAEEDSYTVHGTTIDKSITSYELTGLEADAYYYIRIRTYTPAHDNQRNELWSDYSEIKGRYTSDMKFPTGEPILTDTPFPTSTSTNTPVPTPISTPMPQLDSYELDDTCQRARLLEVDNPAQAHTFHQADDEDWVNMDLQGGVSYQLIANGTNPDTRPEIEVYLRCDDIPEFPSTPNLGNDAELIFTAPSAGRYYALIRNRDGNIFGDDVSYELSLSTQDSGGDLAIIITGHDNGFTLQQNIFSAANTAYRTFLSGGISKTRIRYLGLKDDDRGDADRDGTSDVDTEATVENIKVVITEWAVEQADSESRIFVYMMDHGLVDHMLINGQDDVLWADELDGWLSVLESETAAPVAVIYEACLSGSFITGIKNISRSGRIVITSTDDETNAFPRQHGGAHFSDAFFSALRRGRNFEEAFDIGRDASVQTQLNQRPMLDDNGDNRYSRSDGSLARSWRLGGFGVTGEAEEYPALDTPQAPDLQSIINGQGSIQVATSNGTSIATVWADVYRPDFVEPMPTTNGLLPELDLDRVEFSDNDGDGIYVGLYDNFMLDGVYRFVVYGEDNLGNQVMPAVLEMEYEKREEGKHRLYLPVIQR